MILYEQGAPYWHQMRLFNANKQLPGMALHTAEKMSEVCAASTSPAVQRRCMSFVARHSPRSTA